MCLKNTMCQLGEIAGVVIPTAFFSLRGQSSGSGWRCQFGEIMSVVLNGIGGSVGFQYICGLMNLLTDQRWRTSYNFSRFSTIILNKASLWHRKY